jgi:hypothetical protein
MPGQRIRWKPDEIGFVVAFFFKNKRRLQPWDNCKRPKFGVYFPHLSRRLTPSVELTTWYLVAPPTLSQARRQTMSSNDETRKPNKIRLPGVFAFQSRPAGFRSLSNSYTIRREEFALGRTFGVHQVDREKRCDSEALKISSKMRFTWLV